jgi:hypothetical protein
LIPTAAAGHAPQIARHPRDNRLPSEEIFGCFAPDFDDAATIPDELNHVGMLEVVGVPLVLLK